MSNSKKQKIPVRRNLLQVDINMLDTAGLDRYANWLPSNHYTSHLQHSRNN